MREKLIPMRTGPRELINCLFTSFSAYFALKEKISAEVYKRRKDLRDLGNI